LKIHADFVTNSSSTCYVIFNTSDSERTLGDFFEEVKDVLSKDLQEYSEDCELTMDDILEELNYDKNRIIKPKGAISWFGFDGYGDSFPTIMRYSKGVSENFIWQEFSD